MTYTWDSDNKLRSADIDANGTADVNFQYDALGRRVARTGTGGSVVFVQMDQQTIAGYPVGGAATTPTFRYVYASYIDEPVVRKGPTSTSTAHFYHRNHQYSVTAITTSTGAIAERYAYTAYGQPTILNASGTPLSPQTSTLNSRYSYTGREWDATLGLHHFRARWMSPIAGRFLTRDPIGFKGGDLNLTSYVRNRATVFRDPTGHMWSGDFVDGNTGGWLIIDIWNYFNPKPCNRFYFGYSPVKPSGRPSQDCAAQASGANHVSICSTDCNKEGVETEHPGRGGTSRCGMDGSKYCEITQKSSGNLKDANGADLKPCSAATSTEISNCVASIPQLPGPFHNLTNNCHWDAAHRATNCCLDYSNCRAVIPSVTGCVLW
jgi:RHS repeat-associated protein